MTDDILSETERIEDNAEHNDGTGESGIPHEFRTAIEAGHVSPDSAESVAELLIKRNELSPNSRARIKMMSERAPGLRKP